MITTSHAHGTVVGGLGIRSSGICLCPHLSLSLSLSKFSKHLSNKYQKQAQNSYPQFGVGAKKKEKKKKKKRESEYLILGVLYCYVGYPQLMQLSQSVRLEKIWSLMSLQKPFVVSSLSLSLSLGNGCHFPKPPTLGSAPAAQSVGVQTSLPVFDPTHFLPFTNQVLSGPHPILYLVSLVFFPPKLQK